MTRRFAIPKALTSALAVSLAVLAIPQRGEASPYKVTFLDSWITPQLDNDGIVSGGVRPMGWDKGIYGYFYDSNPGGGVTVTGITLPTASQPGSYDFQGSILSLNDRGQGLGFNPGTNEVMLFDSRTGAATPLSFSTKDMSGRPQITDSGAIYGTRQSMGANGFVDYRPFVYRDGALQDLDLPPGMVGAQLLAADDAGRLLVRAAAPSDGLPDYNAHTMLLDNGRWTDLGKLLIGGFSGRNMNANGDVVGNTHVPWPQFTHAILVPNGGEAIDLGELSGHEWSIASAINNMGQIVGSFSDSDGNGAVAFLYQDGVMTSLKDLINADDGWMIHEAITINDRGQILASAANEKLGGGYVLLTPGDQPTPPDFLLPEMPVPEPSTWVVFALAAVGLGCREAKKRGRTHRGL